MIAASPAKGCGSSCLRSCAGEEGSSWPSGPPVLRGGGCDDHILSDGRLHLSPFPPAPKEQVRSISNLRRKIRAQIRQGRRMPDQGSADTADVLRPSRRSLGPLANLEPDRERVR